MKALTMLGLLMLLWLGRAHAQWAVADAANLVQTTLTALSTAASYVRQGEQVINEYNLIRNQIVQIEHEVTNLQRLPEGLNMLETIGAYGNKVTGVLARANAVSYELDQATSDFEKLYMRTAAITTAQDIYTLRQQLLTAKLQASGMSVQMTAVRTNLSDVYTRVCNLLNGAWTAKGNLDSQQMAAQQQALLLHSQQMAQAMLATQGRLQAQQAAEDAVLEQMRLKMLQEATAPVAPYTDAKGKLPVYRWMDQ